MIYQTLVECLEDCKKTGVLKAKGLSEKEYAQERIGFQPRLLEEDCGE